MKISTLVLALIAIPASHAMADTSLPSYVLAGLNELKIKVAVLSGCSLAGAILGAVLARRISKKNRMLRDLTFSLSVLAGSGVGMFVVLGNIAW